MSKPITFTDLQRKTAKAGELLRRVIHPEVRVLSEKDGTVEYIASDETLDAYREVVSVGGWRFNQFKKNSPFVDSHNYSSVGMVLGRVINWKIEGGKLIETVQWAKDMPGTLAEWGWKMTVGGFLKAVSVGFYPTKMVTKWDSDKTGWLAALQSHKLHEEDGVCCIYLEQEQVELSACVIGANPSAVALAYKAGVLDDQALEGIEQFLARRANLTAAAQPPRRAAADSRGKTMAFALESTAAALRIGK